jgi:SAM-dependent methyltransferase
MLEYDVEAAHYDATRGGAPRAAAAAQAVRRLVPVHGQVLDIAGGTGIVSQQVVLGSSAAVTVLDLSHGMLRKAAERLPGRQVQGDATALPIASGSVDLVTAIWLLHLIDDAAPVVAEAARVLGAGGAFVTTVDKNAAHGHRDPATGPVDGLARLTELASGHGLTLTGTTTFEGLGQQRPDGAMPVFTVAAFARPA